jgi:hypothetical protein
MRLAAISLCIAVIPLMAIAQPKPKSTSYFDSSFDGVIAQFVDGGSWKSIITLINIDTAPGTYKLSFYADNGSPMTIQTSDGTGTTLTGTIPAGGSHVIQSAGTNATLSQGWALLDAGTTNIGGTAIFRQSIPGRPDFEASLPIVTYVNASQYLLPMDNSTSTTGVAIANPLSYTPMTIYVTFKDEQGAQYLVDSFTLPALGHTAFNLVDRYPASAGKRGVVLFATPNLALGLLGLRFGAQSFTSVLPLTPLF